MAMSSTKDSDAETGGLDEGRLVRMLVGGKALQRRRLRRLVLAHLLRERGESEDDDEGLGEDVAGEDDHRLAKLLLAGGIVRRKRIRRALLAHLIQERRASPCRSISGGKTPAILSANIRARA